MQLDANFSKLRRLHSYKLRVKTVGRYLHGQFPETRSTGEVVGLAGREGEGQGGREGGGGYKVQESERLLVTVKVRAARRLMVKVSWCLS